MPDADDHEAALDRALDELYGVEPGAFVTRRTELVKELRAVGAKEEARALAKARRPSNAAWALNALARSEPALIAAVIEAGATLSRQVRSGDAAKIRSATRARRSAVDAAVAAAVDAAVAVSTNADGLRPALAASLEAASVDDDLATDLAAGRLVHEPEATFGFPDVPGLQLVPKLPPEPENDREVAPEAERTAARSAKDANRATDAQERRRVAALAVLDKLRAEAAEADEQAASSAREAERARTARDEANARVARAVEELAQADRDLRIASSEQVRREGTACRAADAVARQERRIPSS